MEARFAPYSSITVVDRTPEQSILRTAFEITYVCLTYDMHANASVPQSNTVAGFTALPSDAFAYLIQRHPERIPTKIAMLAPTPDEAFTRYFAGLRRGSLQASGHDVSHQG